MVQIAPSILSANFAQLADEIQRVEVAGANIIHLDIMDGHFVPNITIGPPVVASIRKTTSLPLEVHLMIEDPDAYIHSFVEAGANSISVHVETCKHLNRTLQLIKSHAVKAGVVLNPATSLSVLDEVLRSADYVLIMSVNPGFGGQEFIPSTFEKVERLKKIIQHRGLPVKIEVDGGVGLDNMCDLIRSGAEILVIGSQIFGTADPTATVRKIINVANHCFAATQA
jgi:ribulose-phosphate 3-epimerase